MYDVVIYVHGFGSSSKSSKVDYIQNVCTELEIDFHAVDYDSSLPYEEIINELLTQVNPLVLNKNVLFVGSSLGGFYSIQLANKFCAQVVLLNPSVNPYGTLEKYITESVLGCSITKEVLESYKNVSFPMPKYGGCCLLETDDEVIPYEIALNHLKDIKVIIIEGGDHRFQNLPILKQELIHIINSGMMI